MQADKPEWYPYTNDNNFVVICPFHDELTPSCCIKPNMGTFHCFGCGASGIITEDGSLHTEEKNNSRSTQVQILRDRLKSLEMLFQQGIIHGQLDHSELDIMSGRIKELKFVMKFLAADKISAHAMEIIEEER